MFPQRLSLGALLTIMLLVSLGPLSHAQKSDPAASFTFGEMFHETADEVASVSLGSPTSEYHVTLTADAGGVEKGQQEFGDAAKSPDDSEDSVLALKKRIIELQNRGRLGFRTMKVCSKVDGFGIYSPLESGQPTRRLVLYAEPANVSTLVTSDRYIIDCTVDVTLYEGSGKPIGGKKSMVKIHRVSRSPVMDIYFKIGLSLKKPPKTDLIIRTVLHDNIKNQSATATYRINVKRKEQKGPDEV